MVNLGLMRRTLRETLPTSLVFALFIGLVAGLLSYALPQVQARFMSRNFIPPGVQQFRNAMLGVDAASGSVADIAFAIAWSHPLVVILLFAHAMLIGTRMPAGEIERGTVDVLMALPVSRWKLFRSETAASLVTAALVLGAVIFGSFIGSRFIRESYRPSDWGRLAMVLGNLGLVYAAVGSAAICLAAGVDRRMRAVLAVLVLSIGSLLITFLEPLWEPIKDVKFLSLLNYYRPFDMLSKGDWPWRDLGILAGISLGLWVIAGVIFARRDITTT